MFIEDLKNDFYAKLKGKRVLILVNYDVDAICACKILQALFNTDGILYSVVSVDLASDLLACFTERRSDEKYVLLINCGATLDIFEFLELSEDIELYILDSHRPLDVRNVYNRNQIKLIIPRKDVEAVPDYIDIFSDSDNDSDDDDDGEEGENDGEEAALDARIEKRQKRREFEKKRQEILFQYERCNYYSRSSAAIAFELAWKLSKDNFDLLWFAIVGVSEQLLLNKLDESSYISECIDFQQHITRLQHRGSTTAEERGISLNIEYTKHLRLALYKNWTIESSMLHSVTTAVKFKLWTYDGVKKLHEMLAKMGFPLVQCRQRFSSMQALYKQELHEAVVQAASKIGLSSIEFGSFSLLHGYRAALPAMDVVYGLIGLFIADKGKSERFVDALEAVTRSRRDRLDEGIDICKKLLETISRSVKSALETSQIRNAGDFVYLVIQEENNLFSHPYSILLLAEYALKAYMANRSNREREELPMIVSVPCGQLDGEGLCHVAAIPTVADESNQGIFGMAFEVSAKQSQTEILARYFDVSVIQIRLKDRGRFFDALAALAKYT